MAISCTAADLLAASKCLCGIPSGKREQVMIYLLQQLAGLGNLTAAQLLDRAKCLCGLSEHDMKAIEVALLCTATGGVPPCPPCPPSGGCTYQDMQVAWTPTSANLGALFGYINQAGDSTITGITFKELSYLSIQLENWTALTTFSLPNATAIIFDNAGGGSLLLANNPVLASISAPFLTVVPGTLDTSNNASLTALDFSSLQSAFTYALNDCPQITSIDLPAALSGGGGPFQGISISGCSLLTHFSIPLYVPADGQFFFGADAHLDAASVNGVLARFVANPAYVSGTIDLTGVNMSAPTGQGLLDKATLIGRGATVNTQ